MGGLFSIIAIPFGWVLKLCYMLVQNYGWALFIFTVLIKLLLLPSSIKTQKSSAKMARLQPKLEQLKKKYANNQEKLNEATMELYSRENVSPMGSCLPMIITMVLLFAIIEVVYAPLTHLGNLDKAQLESAQSTVYNYYTVSQALETNKVEVSAETNIVELLNGYKAEEESSIAKLNLSDDQIASIANTINAKPEIVEYFNDETKVSDKLISSGASSRTQLLVLSVANDYPEIFDAEVAALCDKLLPNYTFLGVYLGNYPAWSNILILIPIISLLSQLAVTLVSQYFQKKNTKGAASVKGMTAMLYIMPIFSFFIAFSFPAGIGIYWIFSSLTAVAQTVFLNLYYTPERMEKILEKESKKARKKPSLYQTMLEKQKEQLAGTRALEAESEEELTEEVKLSRAEKKEAERNALNEARRRYAEKYGDKLD